MKAWLISVAGIIILTSCIEMLLPSGKIKNSCRTVLAMVCVAVIVSPITAIKNLEFSSIAIDTYIKQEYVDSTDEYYCRLAENEITYHLKGEDIEVVECVIKGEIENGVFIVKKANVKVKKSVITEEDEHIISIVEIQSMVASYLGILPTEVRVVEQ